MSVLPSCWDNIIGITRKSDICIDEVGIPIDYNISNSGLFIDELRGINLRLVQDLGTETDLWDRIEVSKENAIRAFQIDILNEVRKSNHSRIDLFKGNIGSQRYTKNLSVSNTYAGVRMYCNAIRGGYFHLTGINTIFGTTGQITVTVYNNLSEDAITSFTINTTANRVESNSIDLSLPLWNDEYDNLEYYFIYELTQTPKDNQPTCNCGGVHWCFNVQNPCFADGKATKDRWRQFAMVGGTQGDTISDRENWYTSKVMNGIVLIGQYQCNPIVYFCNEDQDFENNDYDIAVAYAILYKTGEFLMDEFLDTREITRYTALGLEVINNNREYYNSRYIEMINFLSSNIDINRFGCLKCKPSMGYIKGFQKL